MSRCGFKDKNMASEAGKKGWINSIASRQKLYDAARAAYASNPKLCRFCGHPLTFEKRKLTYCSRSHSAMFNNRGVRRHEKLHFCIVCGKKFNRHNRGYCSKECELTYKKQQNICRFQTRARKGLPIDGKIIRAYLLNTRPHVCEDCGLETWNNEEIPLDSHHKDGNSKNNSDENLGLICPNCHAQTDTYKSKNRGKGRVERQIYPINLSKAIAGET